MADTTIAELQEHIRAVANEAGGDVSLHAVDIAGGAEVGVNERQLGVAASVIKVAVALELYRQAAIEGLDLTEQVLINAANRTPGPTGLSLAQDDATLSLRDLASAMLAISDNAATDAIIARVGLARVNATMQELGLPDTVLETDLGGLIASLAEDAGVPSLDALWSLAEAEREAGFAKCRALQPAHANRTTPYDMSRLLALIWRDEAGPEEACAEVRRLLAQQASYRLAVGFPGEVGVRAKSGGLMGKVRNEIGVVSYPDGGRYAVAVFMVAHQRAARQPKLDQAIGDVAALAVGYLRGD